MESYGLQRARNAVQIVSGVALACNLMVVVIFAIKKHLRVKYYGFLFNLVLTDIAHATLAIVFITQYSPLASALFRTSFFVTELNVLAVAVNRLMALSILPPARYDAMVTPFRMFVVCILFWVVSAAIYIPTTYAVNLPVVTRFIRPLVALAILVLTLALYCIVFCKLAAYRSAEASPTTNKDNDQTQTRITQTRSLMMTFSIILIMSFLCWIPYCICQFMMYFSGKDWYGQTELFRIIFIYTLAWLMVNSAVNPFIYWWRIPEICGNRSCAGGGKTSGDALVLSTNMGTTVESTTNM
ncbi:adrenocorticotropic hormone receptor-like [Acanthaster planci]|uniref:Adrenocorticotropic hormone receptor-like n=1 Tax=Acanthaster planci TaxID=133434 RepID=A0A8B7ZVE0_ACAPL|nr:adrenocorticotropic hormone receptor-like [Acanthaster planci]